MREHIETRRKLKNMYDVRALDDLLNRCILTEEEKHITRMHYLQGKELTFIGDMLGYSESTIKRKHKHILSKLSNLL